VFQDEEAALNWRRNTIVFLRENDFGSLEEIRHSLDNHNTHPADGHARLYVLARRNGRISLVLNASHALLDFASVTVVWQTLIDELALENQERIEWGVEVANLPRPIANVLSEAYPQSWFQWFKSMFDMVRALGNARAVRFTQHPPSSPMTNNLHLPGIDPPAVTSSACGTSARNGLSYSYFHRGRDNTLRQTLQRGEDHCHLRLHRYCCSCIARLIRQ